MIDFDTQATRTIYVFDQQDFRPRAMRVSAMRLDRNEPYIISAAKLKNHDRIEQQLKGKDPPNKDGQSHIPIYPGEN